MLMVRRAVQTGYGLWSMPGGYVDRGEPVETAAAREVEEEAGLLVEVGQLIGLFLGCGQSGGGSSVRGDGSRGCAGPGARVFGRGVFFALDDLPPLAFPRDEQILRRWQRIRDQRR